MSADPVEGRKLFLEVLRCQSIEERDAYLDELCRHDAELRNYVAELIEAHEQAGTVFQQDPAVPDTVIDSTVSEAPGTIIGPYELLEEIGEGGMGVVYRAEQKEPVKRQVALKIVKPGMDSKQVITRFEAERQALALMDHPNIAKALDAGQTGSGLPYFVMELVDGISVTRFCDQEQLTLHQRLELFVPICHAVQHAHQKGVIHRDIKPSNILVSVYDGQPVPKIIDFGVAKATGRALTDKTMFTQVGQMMGTLEYMSPEQIQRNELDTDSRSDIYSLGVVLYELLTGDTPFNRQRLHSAALDELLHIIREEEPMKPSTKVRSTHVSSSTGVARIVERNRQFQPIQVELDWIVMTALEKDRTRRYQTANSLANDIERFLNNQPIEASPPSATYRLRKFAHRHKFAIATIVGLTLSLILGLVGTTWQLLRATEAWKVADAQFKAANEQRQIAESVIEIVTVDVLGGADPFAAGGGDIKLRTVLDNASREIEQETFEEEPLVEAGIRAMLGRVYHNLGVTDEAEHHVSEAWKIRRHHLGERHVGTLNCVMELGKIRQSQGRYDEAHEILDRTLRIALQYHGENHETTLAARNYFAMLLQQLGRFNEALPLLEQNLRMAPRVWGEKNKNTLSTMANLALVYHRVGRLSDSRELHEQALELKQKYLVEDDPATLASMDNLALLYRTLRRFAEAQALHAKALKIRRERFGNDHPQTAASMNNLAVLYCEQGMYEQSETLFEEAMEVLRRTRGDEHPYTLSTMEHFAVLRLAQDRTEEAKELLLRTLAIRSRLYGDESPQTLKSMVSLAKLYRKTGDADAAEDLCQTILERRQKTLGPEHPFTLSAMNNLATLYFDQGQFDEAERLFVNAVDLRLEKLGQEDPRTHGSMFNLAWLYQIQGKYAAAEPHLRKLVSVYRQIGEHLDPAGNWLATLGECLLHQEQYAEAEPLLREVFTLREQIVPDDWRYFHSMHLLGTCLLAQLPLLAGNGGNSADAAFEEAERLLEDGFVGMKDRKTDIPEVQGKNIARNFGLVIQLYEERDKPEKVVEWHSRREIFSD